MFKNMKLGAKVGLGFGIVVFIAVILGIAGYYSTSVNFKSINELGAIRLPSVQNLLVIQQGALDIKCTQRTLLNYDLDKATRKRQYDLFNQARDYYTKAWDIYEALPQTSEEAIVWKDLVPTWEAWRSANNKFCELAKECDALAVGNPFRLRESLERFRGDHFKLETQVLTMLHSKEVFDGGEDHTACAFGKWKAQQQFDNPQMAAALKACDETHKHFHEAVKQIKALVKSGDVEAAYKILNEKMNPAADKTFTHFVDMTAIAQKAQELADKAQVAAMQDCRTHQLKAYDLLTKLVEINVDAAHKAAAGAMTSASFFKMLAVSATLAGLILAIVLSIVIIKAITKPINKIIAGLTEGSSQVASAAGQVSAASQSLAEGATEQAAGLEETSSSLEEMSSMTKQNAENAQQAASLAGAARNAATNGNDAIGKMTSAITEIQKSSNETAKIIKVIDEIAFQTNLLALNAAVEAARAGEAGKGFAVVAEEVRNLAMRSAQAAKNTSAMIEESVKNAKNGVEITNEVSKVLGEIVGAASKTADLIGEIAASSQEQAKGIDQVNVAVSQMDKVTQSNAANAEESASASEELSAQAATMNDVVAELVALVGGASAKTDTFNNAHSNKVSAKSRNLSISDHTFHQIAEKGTSKKVSAKRSVDACKAIPLNDSDLNSFNS